MYVVNGGEAELRRGGGAVAAIDLTALRQEENSHALASLLYNVHSRSCVYFRQVVKISMFYDTILLHTRGVRSKHRQPL